MKQIGQIDSERKTYQILELKKGLKGLNEILPVWMLVLWLE